MEGGAGGTGELEEVDTAAGESGRGSGSLRFAGGSSWMVGVRLLLLLFAALLLPPPAPPLIAGEWMAAAAAMADIVSPTAKDRQKFHRKLQWFLCVSIFTRLVD